MTPKPLDRRTFLQAVGMAGATAAVGASPRDGQDRLGAALPRPVLSWIDRPMRWAQLTLVEDDPGKFDPEFWLDYFAAHQVRRRLPQRRRLRRLLPDAGSVSPPQRLARRPRRLRRTRRRLSQARNGRHRAHRPARDLRRRAGGAPGLDRRGRGRQAAPSLGVAGDVGHVRARSVQLRVHDRGEEGDHVPLPRGRHLHQPLGRLGHVLLRALPEELPGGVRPRPPAHRRPAGPGAARLSSSGVSNGCSTCGRPGTGRCARSTPTPASFRTPAAARPAASTWRRSASWRPCSWPTARRAAA